jgi:hypothetical protein
LLLSVSLIGLTVLVVVLVVLLLLISGAPVDDATSCPVHQTHDHSARQSLHVVRRVQSTNTVEFIDAVELAIGGWKKIDLFFVEVGQETLIH